MATYVLLTKISPESMRTPGNLGKLEQQVKNTIKKHCPVRQPPGRDGLLATPQAGH